MPKKFKKIKKKFIYSKILKKCPQKKGICIKVYTTSPKKPNSAVRKIAKVKIRSNNVKTIVGIPGQGHKLQEYSTILIRGGRVNDVPGVRFKAIRGKYDFNWAESFFRSKRRSKYGIPKKLKN
jgi:small subunit ribosomal protein S12